MVTITFPDRETEKRALAFLIGRSSGTVLRSGGHIVPEMALEVLADQNIPFAVRREASDDQQSVGLRDTAAGYAALRAMIGLVKEGPTDLSIKHDGHPGAPT
jgi:hypothetical protein